VDAVERSDDDAVVAPERPEDLLAQLLIATPDDDLASASVARLDVDILPAMNDQDSNRYATLKGRACAGSCFTGKTRTPKPPRAVTTCPDAMFLAAFTSAFGLCPQETHAKTASLLPLSDAICLQALQVCDVYAALTFRAVGGFYVEFHIEATDQARSSMGGAPAPGPGGSSSSAPRPPGESSAATR